MVLSRRSSASIRSSSARPARASPPSRVQRRSVSMIRPSISSEPSSSASRSSRAASLWAAAANERTKVSWWSLPGSASSSSRRTPSSQVARSAARLAGAEKLLAAWAAYAGIREEPNASVSTAMLPSTSVDEVGGAHLGVAGHVPRGAPAQRARERVVEPREAGDHGLERALVEADLGVGQVAVVEQQQVGLAYADQLRDRGRLALDVHLDVRTTDQVAVRPRRTGRCRSGDDAASGARPWRSAAPRTSV